MIPSRFLVLTLFVFGAAVTRLLPHPPNFTPMVPLALFSGAYFTSRRASYLVPLAAMLISDVGLAWMYGYALLSPMRLIIYATFALITWAGSFLKNRVKAIPVLGYTLGGALVFHLISNFAVWATGRMYPLTLEGLLACYIASIPFFNTLLAGSLTYGILLFGGFEILQRLVPKLASTTTGRSLLSSNQALLYLALLPCFTATIPSSASATDTRGKAAEENKADTVKMYVLPEIVVTATRADRIAWEVGRSVSVISKSKLGSQLANSAAEVISQYEGIYVVGVGQNPGMVQSLFTRGANSNHTTILIDDVRITDPSAVNNALDLTELSLIDADRVEIVRGSHGTLYGSSAIGGVLNVITNKKLDPGFHGDVELKAGTFGSNTSTFSQLLFLNYTLPQGWYFNAAGRNMVTQGLDATVDTVSHPDRFTVDDRDGFAKRDVMAKAGYQDEVWDAYISVRGTRHRVDIDKGAYRDDENARLDFNRTLFTYGASYAFSPSVRLKYVGGNSEMRRYFVDDSSLVDRSGTTDHTYFDATYRGTIFTHELLSSLTTDGLQLTVGGGWYGERMGSSTYYFSRSRWGVFEFSTNLDTLGLRATTRSLFARTDFNGTLLAHSLDRWGLGLGVRLNKHSSFGSHATFEVNPTFRLNEATLLYGSLSTGFNAPSLYQLFVPAAHNLSGITRGNRNLQPERSTSYELGLKYRFGDALRLTASYFATDVDDVIEYVYLWNKDVSVDQLGKDWRRDDFRGDTYLNLGQLRTRGLEFTFQLSLAQEVMLSGNVSLVGGKLVYDPEMLDRTHTQGHHVQIYNNGSFVNRAVESLGLTRRPNTFHLSLQMGPYGSWGGRFDVRHVGSRSDVYYESRLGPYGALNTIGVEEYTVVDLTLRWHLLPQLSMMARIENLFDVTYYEIHGFTTRGRGVFASLRYSF
jgi:vitamin B12 transporter